jgi:hypothetical protein
VKTSNLTIQALLASVDDTALRKYGSVTYQLENSLKLRKVYGLASIPNKCLRHLSRRSLA